MDGPSLGHNTDVIVVADPVKRSLTWVPRDLWCPRREMRINRLYAHGGERSLREGLRGQGIDAAHCLCLRPDGIRPALEGVRVKMPIREPMEFEYEGGWVRFEPPVEELHGERIHAWIGARRHRGGSPPGWLPDLDRIRRQQELIAVLLGDDFDFGRFLAPGLPVKASSDAAIEELRQVRWDWTFAVVADVVPAEIEGKQVLVRR